MAIGMRVEGQPELQRQSKYRVPSFFGTPLLVGLARGRGVIAVYFYHLVCILLLFESISNGKSCSGSATQIDKSVVRGTRPPQTTHDPIAACMRHQEEYDSPQIRFINQNSPHNKNTFAQ